MCVKRVVCKTSADDLEVSPDGWLMQLVTRAEAAQGGARR